MKRKGRRERGGEKVHCETVKNIQRLKKNRSDEGEWKGREELRQWETEKNMQRLIEK